MRLAAKISLASLVPLLILVQAASWGLTSLNRLVGTNQRIVNQTLPALRQQAAAGEVMASLVRLHARWMTLRDPSYQTLWNTRTATLQASLDDLAARLRSPAERRLLRKTDRAFAQYRAFASTPGADGTRLRAVPPADLHALRGSAERVTRMIRHLGTAIDDGARRAQETAATLEANTWRTVLIALPVSAAFALLFSFAIALRLTRVLRRLATASERLALGVPTEPVGVNRNDELGQLARAFDTMAAKLRELDHLKEQVYSHVSHELRTPLTSIREAIHLLADGVAGPLQPRQERLVVIITESTERLLRLVNRILDVSRLRAGLQPIERRPVRLGTIATRALQELRPQADAAGVRIDHVGDGGDPEVLGDEERLVEVVVNLVSNAIKASPDGGVVRIDVHRDAACVRLVVADDGIGIPRDVLSRIFDPYVQAPGAPAGTGLGLAIVKSIVEAHGGEVVVESDPGHGSRFTVRLSLQGTAA